MKPRYSMGTSNHRGGLAWVGEYGPELVNMPRESRVTPNHNLANAEMNLEVNIHGATSEPRVERSAGRLDLFFDEAVANVLTRSKARGVVRDAYGFRGRARGS